MVALERDRPHDCPQARRGAWLRVFTDDRAEAAALRQRAEPDIVWAEPRSAGLFDVRQARREFYALASLHGERAGMRKELVRMALMGMLAEVLPL